MSSTIAEGQIDISALMEQTAEQVTKKYICQDCGQGFETPQGLGGHKARAHSATAGKVVTKGHDVTDVKTGEKMWTCPDCGKTMRSSGKGGHMHGHKISPKQKQLLKLIREKNGLRPMEYAAMLGVSMGSLSGLGNQLKKRGKIRTVGHTQSTRYYINRGGGKKMPEQTIKATASPATPKGKKAPAKKAPVLKSEVEAKKVLLIGENLLIIDGEVYQFTKKKLTV